MEQSYEQPLTNMTVRPHIVHLDRLDSYDDLLTETNRASLYERTVDPIGRVYIATRWCLTHSLDVII